MILALSKIVQELRAIIGHETTAVSINTKVHGKRRRWRGWHDPEVKRSKVRVSVSVGKDGSACR